MKFEKIPKDNFDIKIELNAVEAKNLLVDLDYAESEQNFEDGTKEFHKQLRALI